MILFVLSLKGSYGVVHLLVGGFNLGFRLACDLHAFSSLRVKIYTN